MVKQSRRLLLVIHLGSHSIGGFTENFSHSQYFCRYCEIIRREFQSDDPNVCGPQRNAESYDPAVGDLLYKLESVTASKE